MNLWKNNIPWFTFTQQVLDDFLVLFVPEMIPVEELSLSVVFLQYPHNHSAPKYTAKLNNYSHEDT